MTAAPLAEAGGAAAAFAGDGIAVGRIDIAQGHLTGELRLDRPHLGDDLRRQFGVGMLLDLLTSGDALFQDFRIVEGGPDLFLGAVIR